MIVFGQTTSPCVNRVVFGFVQSHEKDNFSDFSNLHWELLTHVVDFSQPILPNGTLPNQISSTSQLLIATAKAHGVKPILCVSSATVGCNKSLSGFGVIA